MVEVLGPAIDLADGAKLMDYVTIASAKEAPPCPRCVADMVFRTAKKGDKVGGSLGDARLILSVMQLSYSAQSKSLYLPEASD
jgi:hypothetical protein